MPKFDTMNEISVPSLTDKELKALLAKANEEELMYALGYHKRLRSTYYDRARVCRLNQSRKILY